MSAMVLPSSFELPSASPFRMEGFNCWPPAGQYDPYDPLAANSNVVAAFAEDVEEEEEEEEEEDERPRQIDVWNAIQSQKADSPPTPAFAAAPYVHPLMRRSSSMLSQKSLEICTESLGSETGSDEFSSSGDGLDCCYSPWNEPVVQQQSHDYMHEGQQQQQVLSHDEEPTYRIVVAEDMPTGVDQVQHRTKGRQLTSVNYHCSISRKSPSRSFPPPLPSISRRDGPCIRMKPHRRDGRLVVEAVPVPSQNYLHAQREGGRLLLSFIDATFDESETADKYSSAAAEAPQSEEQVTEDNEESQETIEVKVAETKQYLTAEGQEEDEELLEEEEEEEVEVVDRGTVVEVKVSSQTQQQSSASKVVRSSLVINKFVGGTPLSNKASRAVEECELPPPEKNESKTIHTYATAPLAARRAVPTTTTTPAAAAVVAASTISTISTDSYNEYYAANGGEDRGSKEPLDNKLLFTSKRRNREQLLHNMRRCSQLRRPLFIWEPCCIATST